jgi:hypothetical protein
MLYPTLPRKQVTGGDVMNPDDITAVHHRKVGNYY